MSSDADADYLAALLQSSLERAGEVEHQHGQLLEQHGRATTALTAEMDSNVAAMQQQQAALVTAQRTFHLLREAEVGKGREQAAAMLGAARQEVAGIVSKCRVMEVQRAADEADHRARLTQLKHQHHAADQAHRSAMRERELAIEERQAAATRQRDEDDRARMAQMEEEQSAHLAAIEQRRAELEQQLAARRQHMVESEAATQTRLEAFAVDHLKKVAAQQEQCTVSCAAKERTLAESIADREHAFTASCAAKTEALEALVEKEREIQSRIGEIQGLAAEKRGTSVKLNVAGTIFETTVAALVVFPHSMLAELWHCYCTGSATGAGEKQDSPGPMRVDGDPSQFHLILSYLRRAKVASPPEAAELPAVANVGQIQWLESEAR